VRRALETRESAAQLPTKDLHRLVCSAHSSTVANLDYYTSQRFIHDQLCREVEEGGIQTIYDSWEDESFAPFFITWPGRSFVDDDGMVRDGPVIVELPEEEANWRSQMEAAVKRTNAWAVLLASQKDEDAIHVLLETPHGTRRWAIPIEDRGDHRGLGSPTVEDDKDLLSLVWRPKGQS